MFVPGSLVVLSVGLFAIAFPKTAESVIGALQSDVVLVAAFVFFALWMGLSRFGDIMLGCDDDVPAYSTGYFDAWPSASSVAVVARFAGRRLIATPVSNGIPASGYLPPEVSVRLQAGVPASRS